MILNVENRARGLLPKKRGAEPVRVLERNLDIVVAVMILMLVASAGAGYGGAIVLQGNKVGSTSTFTVTTTSTFQNTSAPYVLVLVVSTGNTFNSTVGEQPAFYVVGPKGLQPATHLSIPAHRTIKLIIFNYDEGNASLEASSYARVTGTTNGTISYGNNGMINATQANGSISVRGMQTVAQVPADTVAHTFTIPSLNINIPIPVSATVVATFTVDKTGTFVWFCMTACGSGSDGLGGAMAAPGWMTGDLTSS
jgi:heme/copper-type cytochrome/quinol oxidase subunit 2